MLENTNSLQEDVNLQEEEEIAKANGETHSGYYYLDLALNSKWD